MQEKNLTVPKNAADSKTFYATLFQELFIFELFIPFGIDQLRGSTTILCADFERNNNQ